MIIDRVMTRNPVFIHPDMSVNEVRSLMDKEKIGHLPVLDKGNRLVGIVTREDLIKAAPSAATTLDMYEISYLLSKMTAENVMVKKVITVAENEVVEEAARVMADNGIGCLPVMRGDLLVGIITDTDLFHALIDAFGARYRGVRITCLTRDAPGQFAKIASAIAEKGGNFVAFVSAEGDDLTHRRATLKITGIARPDAEAVIRNFPDVEIEDVRES
ncbi:MAG: CBS domain-containing protein [Candidatus Accumulibacter sp.]|jgi:acetoin utilization protein AcuB|nr:CBS domain-containing protein [Accumulibacter sp.]